MVYAHERNFLKKIADNYHGVGKKIEHFYYHVYLSMRTKLTDIDYENDADAFVKAADIINAYYVKLDEFTKNNKITFQSKFRPTFLEEISNYLFSNIEYIKKGELNIYNKGIYAGMRIGRDLKVNIMKKDVDFCIGKKVRMKIESKSYEIILPIVAVEVKTYLDATMFGEVQYSSRLLKNATSNVKTYETGVFERRSVN